MSRPSSNLPLSASKAMHEKDVNLPGEYYSTTVIMILLVVAIPFLYRMLWCFTFDLMSICMQTDTTFKPAGCRKVGRPGTRNLSKEHSTTAIDKSVWRVAALFEYPIKSCFPVEVDASTISQRGFEFDRQFCFARWDEAVMAEEGEAGPAPKKGSKQWWKQRAHWEFLTQRSHGFLTKIKIDIWVPDWKVKGYSLDAEFVESRGCLVVSFPYMPPMQSWMHWWTILAAKLKARSWSAIPTWTFCVPLSPSAAQIKQKGYGHDKIRIWSDEPAALDVTSEIPTDLLKMLKHSLNIKTELRLFKIDANKNRAVYKCAPTAQQLGYQANISFQDSYPISLQNMSSIQNVESHIPHSTPLSKPASASASDPDKNGNFTPDARRFRANIYITGPPAFSEENWTLIRIGAHIFHVSSRITRCDLPCRDPDSARRDAKFQPLGYLKLARNVDGGAPAEGCLGMHLVPMGEAVGGAVVVGDEVFVLRTGVHRFVGDGDPGAQVPVL